MGRVSDRIRRVAFRLDIQSWKDLLRDRTRPSRTAIGAGLGACVGGMPLLGLHTWIAGGLGAVLPVPALSVLAGSNISNPLTFLPITWLEIRMGQFLLARPQGFAWEGISVEAIASYWLEAWVGFIVVGPAMGLLTGSILRAILAKRATR